jgi:AraC-like DNA-binding protein
VQVLHDGRSYAHKPGHILWRKAGETITYKIHPAQAVQGIYVHFEAPQDWADTQPRLKIYKGHALPLQLMQYLTNAPKAELQRSGPGILAALVATLKSRVRMPLEARWERLPSAVRHSVDLFRNHPSDDYSLPVLCKSLGTSVSTLSRQFRQSLSMAPLEVLRCLRLEAAAQRLELGNERIAEIADGLGFANPFYFTRLFTSAYGLSPRAYRTRARKSGYGKWRLIERKGAHSKPWA